MNPKISVIMPVYNAEKYIKKTIHSMLEQTYRDFELILIVDCPTDGTMDRINEIKDERIRIIRNPKNMGIAYSRNRGIEEARGEYIALMDHDDLAPPDRLEITAKYLDEHSDIDIVGGSYAKIDSNDEVTWTRGTVPLKNPLYLKAQLMFGCRLANGSSMIRKKLVDDYQIKYEDDFLGMEDYRFWVECSLHGKITNLNHVLLYWRVTDSAETSRVMTNQAEDRKRKFAEIQRYALEKNGFMLDEDDYRVFHESFAENSTKKHSKYELEITFKVLKKIMYQAEELQLENTNEIKIACKKSFARMVELSGEWDK